jgi:leucyl aminopeptidase
MKYEAYSGKATSARGDCLVVGVHEEHRLGEQARLVDKACGGRLMGLLKRGDFSGRAGETLLLPEITGLGGKRLLLVGLGAARQYQRRHWKRALGAAVAALLRTRLGSAVIALDRPEGPGLDHYTLARAAAECVGAGLYRINDLKSGRRPRPYALTRVRLGPYSASELADARRGLNDGAAIASSAQLMRDLANLPSNVCTPRHLANAALKVGREHRGLKVRALNEAQIRRLKMGCFLAVTQGSAEPPRFIVMEYRGARRSAAPLVLVGKGVTFDTGGISLKDPSAMDEMKYDMCGAASVIAALDLAARLQLRINLVGLVAACENMPGGRAIKPGDIVTSMNGQTVEILNTDAEGRLILSDALHYARRYKPAAVVDLATLTGACVVALGAHHSGVMGNNDALARELVECGVRADDRAWQLPLTEDYGEQLKSNFADFANVAGRDGGAITAAAFLGKFTKDLTWAHIDIAGTAWVSGAAKSATGRPMGLLGDFLIRRARA